MYSGPPSYPDFLLIYSYCKRSISLNEIQRITNSLGGQHPVSSLNRSLLPSCSWVSPACSHGSSAVCLQHLGVTRLKGFLCTWEDTGWCGQFPHCPAVTGCRDLCCNQVTQGHGFASCIDVPLSLALYLLFQQLLMAAGHIHSFHSFRMRTYSLFKNTRKRILFPFPPLSSWKALMQVYSALSQ